MKSFTSSVALLGFCVFQCVLSAQDPAAEARRRMSERNNTGNTGSFGSPTAPSQKTVVSYVTYLSKDRQWSDLKGRKMTGRLVAFAAPLPGKKGPIVVVHEGKVRLRRTGAKGNADFPLEQLSQGDRDFVKAIEEAIRRSEKAEEEKKKEEQKGKAQSGG